MELAFFLKTPGGIRLFYSREIITRLFNLKNVLMKTMLAKGLYLLWGCLYYISLVAQNTPATVLPEELADNQTETMHSELSLTPDQMQKIRAINLKYAKEQLEIEKSGKTGLAESIRSKLVELKHILTAEQYNKWEAKRSYWMNLVQDNLAVPSVRETLPVLE